MQEKQRSDGVYTEVKKPISKGALEGQETIEKMVKELSDLLPSSSEMLQQMIEAVSLVDSQADRVSVLKAFVSQLSESQANLLQQVLDYTDPRSEDQAPLRSDLFNHAEVVSLIAARLPNWGLQQFLKNSIQFASESDRVKFLTAIAPKLPETHLLQLLEAVLQEADLQLHNESNWVKFLRAIAPQLSASSPSNLVDTILNAAIRLKDNFFRTEALSAIAPQLSASSPSNLVDTVLNAVVSLKDDFFRAEALSAIAPLLIQSPDQLQIALDASKAILSAPNRAYALRMMAQSLPQDHHLYKQVVQQALDAATNLRPGVGRIEGLSAIAPLLKGEKQKYTQVLLQALQATIALPSEMDRVRTVSVIFSQLSEAPPELLQEALNVATDSNIFPSEAARAEVLSAIVPVLVDETQIQNALNVINNLTSETDRVEFWSAIAIVLQLSTGKRSPNLLQPVLDTAVKIQDKSVCVRLLSAIAPLLTNQRQIQNALNVINHRTSEKDRVEFWSAIVLQLSKGKELANFLQSALDAVVKIQEEPVRVRLLSVIIPQVSTSPDLLQQVWNAAVKIQDQSARAEILSTLSSHWQEQQSSILQQALDIAINLQAGTNQIRVMGMIAPLLSEKDLISVLEAVINLESESDRADTLSIIVPELSKKSDHLLQQALKSVINLRSNLPRARALSVLVPRLSESYRSDHLQRAIDAIKADENERTKAISLNNLMKQLLGYELNILQQALDITLLINDPEQRSVALSSITALTFREDILSTVLERGSFKENDIHFVLSSVLNFTDDKALFKVLHPLNQQVPDELVTHFPNQQLSRALDFIRDDGGLNRDDEKTRLLSTLAPRLSIGLFGQAFNLIQSIEDPNYRIDAFCNLAPYIPEVQFSEAFKLIDDNLENDSHQATALEGFIPYLPDDSLSIIKKCVQEKINEENIKDYRGVLVQIATVLASKGLTLRSLNGKVISNQEKLPEEDSGLIEKIQEITWLTQKILDLTKNLLNNQNNPNDSENEQSVFNILDQMASTILQAGQLEKALELIDGLKSSEDQRKLLCNFQSCISRNISQDNQPSLQTLMSQSIIRLERVNQLIVNVYNNSWLQNEENKRTLKNVDSEEWNESNKLLLRVHAAINSYDLDGQITYDKINKQAAYDKALQMIRDHTNPETKKEALQLLIPHLPDNLCLQAAEIAKAWEDVRVDASQNEGEDSEASQKEQTSKTSEAYTVEALKADVLVSLACRFPEIRADAGDVVQALKDPVERIKQLSRLAVEVPERLLDIIGILGEAKIGEGSETKSEPERKAESEPGNKAETKAQESGQLDGDSSNLESNQQSFNQNRGLNLKPGQQKDILVALDFHLPIHIIREVKRIGEAPTKFSPQLWNRAIKILSRSYRDALRVGSLRNDEAQDQDFLNLRDEINALSNLLLMRDLEPPMTVGILGGWGGGKSYIMHLMQARMTELRSSKVDRKHEAWNRDPTNEKLSPFVGHIYQIKFDAWTFAKANLWASLMQTIFFELDRQLTLEQEIIKVLDDIKDPVKKQDLESKIWPVLYKSSDADRAWFLKRILKDEDLLRKITQQATQGALWEAITEVQRLDRERLEYLQNNLEETKNRLNSEKSKIRQQESQAFKSILEIQNSKHIKQVDALLGVSFELLRRRIGSKLFKELTNQIYQSLYGKPVVSEPDQSSNGSTDTNASSSTNQENQGLWAKLAEVKSQIDKIKAEESKLKGDNKDKSDQTVSGQKNTVNNKTTEDETGEGKVVENQTSETKLNADNVDPAKSIDELLKEASSIELDILDVATKVVEENYGRITLSTLCQWLMRNWRPLVLMFVLSVFPLIVVVICGKNLFTSISVSILGLVGFITPILPAIVLLQNLLKSGASWFEEARMALSEYERAIEQKNKQREERIEAIIERRMAENQEVKKLERKVGKLEQEVREQKAFVPINQYASLSAFVAGRIKAGTYENYLGLMHQVKSLFVNKYYFDCSSANG